MYACSTCHCTFKGRASTSPTALSKKCWHSFSLWHATTLDVISPPHGTSSVSRDDHWWLAKRYQQHALPDTEANAPLADDNQQPVQLGNEYLIVTHYFLKVPIIHQIPVSQCNAAKVISLQKEMFAIHGIIATVWVRPRANITPAPTGSWNHWWKQSSTCFNMTSAVVMIHTLPCC